MLDIKHPIFKNFKKIEVMIVTFVFFGLVGIGQMVILPNVSFATAAGSFKADG